MANNRLVYQLKSRMQEVSLLAGGTVRSAWEQLGSGKSVGYTFDRLIVLPADETFPSEVAEQLMAGKSVSFVSAETPPRARLAAPIILREATIGVIGYDSDNLDHEWQEDEKALLETVASRVSLALENTRLVAEAQQRALREKVIGQVSSRMRETLDIETILKTAVMEMRQSLELREAEVRLHLAEDSKSIEVSNE
jgi:K+-sensing histidine kinase KdpD